MKSAEKFYYIGEASKIAGVPPHIMRFWEKEFPEISPMRDQRGHRIYTKKDIEKINKIKDLVYNNGYRIKGAKKRLRKGPKERPVKTDKRFLQSILKELKEIKKCLE